MAWDKLHQPCTIRQPSGEVGCGSSDGASEDHDGNKYCFVCKQSEINKRTMTDTPDRDIRPVTLKAIDVPELVHVDITSRNIPASVIRKYGAGIDPDKNEFWHIHYVNGVPVAAKIKWYDSKGEKRFRWVGDKSAVSLYGLHVANHRYSVGITEGEMDAYAFHEMTGWGAVSVPFGTGTSPEYIRRALPLLEKAETVYVCCDMDEPGRELSNMLMEMLSPGKAKEVFLPSGYKDACDMLADGKQQEFKQALYSSQPRIPAFIYDKAQLVADGMKQAYDDDLRVGFSTPWETVNEMVGGLRPGDISCFIADPGNGKAVALDEPVIMQDGSLKEHGAIVVGDVLANGVVVEAVSPVWQDRPCYRVTFDDGSSYVVDANHEWQATRRTNGNKRREGVYSTKDMAQDYMHGTRKRYAVRIVPTDYATQDLPIDPYTLGLWLGDGTATSSHITCHADDAEVFNHVPYSVTKCDYSEKLYLVQGLQPYLKDLGVYDNKHIPTEYLHADRWQRFELLRGLLDSDGGVEQGVAVFANSNMFLVNGVVELAQSLGMKALVHYRMGKLNGVETKPCARVRITSPKVQRLFYLERKQSQLRAQQKGSGSKFVVSIERVDNRPTSCLQVSGGLYQLGGHTVTHNSSLMRQLLYHFINTDVRALYIPLEDKPAVSVDQLASLKLGTQVLGETPYEDEKTLEETLWWLVERYDTARHIGYLPLDDMLRGIEYSLRASKTQVVILDHITAMAEAGGENETSFINTAVAEFRKMTQKHDIHLCIVSHLRKGVERASNKPRVPSMDSIKYASSLPQAAGGGIFGLWKTKGGEAQLRLIKSARDYPNVTGMTDTTLVYDPTDGSLLEKRYINIDEYTKEPNGKETQTETEWSDPNLVEQVREDTTGEYEVDEAGDVRAADVRHDTPDNVQAGHPVEDSESAGVEHHQDESHRTEGRLPTAGGSKETPPVQRAVPDSGADGGVKPFWQGATF